MPEIPQRALKPYWQTKDESIILYQGHAPDVLRRMPESIIQCVCTSPPYWKQREYATEEHKVNELGSEATVEEFVVNLVNVLREVKRVLRPDGTLWLNLGDTYVKGNLIGVPWRVAFALQEDGWILRQDIVWHKPSAMPQPCENRCTRAHEFIFMFVKSGGYYYDGEAIKEKLKMTDEEYRKMLTSKHNSKHQRSGTALQSGASRKQDSPNGYYEDNPDKLYVPSGSNKRSVWSISSPGFDGAHFATYPTKLVEPCIKAGTSEHGACSECGAPYERLTDREKLTRERPNEYVKRVGEEGTGNLCGNTVAGVAVKTLGWQPRCKCKEELAEIGVEPSVVPCIVLDPFIGSGTTAVVALAHGRHCVGIDLSEKYLRDNAIPRIQGALLSRPGLAHLAGFEAEMFDGGSELD
jgi:DNA modification methylase